MKLAVVFPGVGYPCSDPVLARSAAQYEKKGYTVLRLDYSLLAQKREQGADMAQLQQLALAETERQLADADFAAAQHIVFISKSIGTVAAGSYAAQHHLFAAQLVFTPLQEALPYLRSGIQVIAVAVGTEDKYIDWHEVYDWCQLRRIYCRVVDGVGHRLAFGDNSGADEEILQLVESLCRE